jgi:hypothetical protein
MAEDLLPTVVPGMVGLRHKKTKAVTHHFPVDAREILSGSKDYDLVDNGAAEAARMNINPLQAIQSANVATEVVGIEGQVLVAMNPEQAEAWKKAQADSAGKEVAPAKTGPQDTAAAADEKPAPKPATK